MSEIPTLQTIRLALEAAKLSQAADQPVGSCTIVLGDKVDCIDMIMRAACVTATTAVGHEARGDWREGGRCRNETIGR